MTDDLIAQLKGACVGNPFAKIPWPHRLLHAAVDEIERLRARDQASSAMLGALEEIEHIFDGPVRDAEEAVNAYDDVARRAVDIIKSARSAGIETEENG